MGAAADTADTAAAAHPAAHDPARAWEAIRANHEIQYAPIAPPKIDPPPGWLTQFLKWLARVMRPVGDALGVSWPVLQWILIGIAALLVAFLLWKLLAPIARIRRERKQAEEQAEHDWAPDREAVLSLLGDADRLAGEGRFDEATRLLLQRSVDQIAEARPEWLGPSSTAREIAALPALPERARGAFRTIAERVERSLFALRRLDAEDWQAARAAYADFALHDLKRGAA
ncbi:MAG: hypothetical protein P0Y56_08000 [Candidatus Andeanibacterium colombiense]|uniref:DUF4129 domain-containing protein n=1 Tax=Candidatus Andeanibacterium colombiense TaxID=3121345 RepID=A0AAJ5X865_9SPHN|nr:MAG: hypothetical protein P0Y56_08000 [Sphingomonadaceae bacterium]